MYKPIQHNSPDGKQETEKQPGFVAEPDHLVNSQNGLPLTTSREHFLNQSLTPANIRNLQQTVGNRSVQRLLAKRSSGPVIQRQTKSKYVLEHLVMDFETKKNETSTLYFKRFYTENKGLDEEDKGIIENFAWNYW